MSLTPRDECRECGTVTAHRHEGLCSNCEQSADLTALRARVAELEGAVRKVVQVADNTARAFPDEVQEKDEYRRGQVRGAMDAARPARALLPAPAPGRDTDGPGTTTSRDLVSEANVTSNASIAAGGDDGE